MKKKVISVVLTAGMVAALLAGCGGTEATSKTDAAADSSAAADTSAAGEEAAAADVDFDGTEITIKMCNTGCVTDDNDRIVEKINEITQEKLGLTVNVEWIGIADYGQQMNLLFSSQESCDIVMTTPVLPYSSMKNQDELMDISEYLDEYGQDIEAIAGNYLQAFSDGDAVYGIPVYREKAGSYFLNMRKDILDELGLTEQAREIDSWSDYLAILDAVKEAHPELTPLYVCPNNNVDIFYDGQYYTGEENWADNYGIDNLGDSNYLVYVDADGKVASYYTSDLFKKNIDLARQIYEAGYVNTDATTVSEDGAVQVKNNVAFSCFGSGESGNEATFSLNSGYETVSVPAVSGTATSFTTTVWGFAVPYTCEYPEAAVAFMNLLYTDSDLANLFVWGEEGVDWQTTDDGYAQYVESDGAAYHSCTWLTGNALLLTPWEGSATVEEQQATIDSEEDSQYLGFFADTTNIEQEVTSCVNVVNEYRNALCAGAAGENTDAMYQEMCDKLEAAGIQTIVDEYQAQLDAWMAEQ